MPKATVYPVKPRRDRPAIPGGAGPRADRLRSEPLTVVGKRLLHALLGAGSADSSYTVRMPSGHGIKVEDPTDLR